MFEWDIGAEVGANIFVQAREMRFTDRDKGSPELMNNPAVEALVREK